VPERRPAILTWRALHLADAAVQDALTARLAAEAGCSLLDHDLLAWLGVAPDQRLRMTELADRLRVTPGGLTRIVDRLERRGWARRVRPVDNRREVHVVLTERGRAGLAAAAAVYAEVVEDVFARHLDDDDLRALDAIGRKLLGDQPGCWTAPPTERTGPAG
jgi:DNA-binding MarR family transcriptional regulator